MKINYESTALATLKEVLEVIAKELNIINSSKWVAEKVAKSRIHSKNIYSYIIKGRETNKAIHKDKEMEIGRIWVFSLTKDKQGNDSWVFQSFVTFGWAKEYYIKEKEKGKDVWLFLNGWLVEEEDLEFNLYELEYQPGVVEGFRFKEEVEDRLFRHYTNEDSIIIDDKVVEFTMKVFKQGKELPYIYNNETRSIELGLN